MIAITKKLSKQLWFKLAWTFRVTNQFYSSLNHQDTFAVVKFKVNDEITQEIEVPYNAYRLRRSKTLLGLFRNFKHRVECPADTRVLIDRHNSNIYLPGFSFDIFSRECFGAIELKVLMYDFERHDENSDFDDFPELIVLRFQDSRDAIRFKLAHT